MKKAVRFLVQMMVLLFFLGLAVGVQAEKKGENLLREATLISSHKCYIPYNIYLPDYGYDTGLHIITDVTQDILFRIDFYCGGNAYAFNIISVSPKGWTGTIDELLHKGGQNSEIPHAKFPTLIVLRSYMDPDHPGEEIPFWVTQFLFTQNGFSHVVFTSTPIQNK